MMSDFPQLEKSKFKQKSNLKVLDFMKLVKELHNYTC